MKLPNTNEKNMYVSNRGRKLKPLNHSMLKKEASKVVKAEDKPVENKAEEVVVRENIAPKEPENEEVIEEAQ
jgi:hypothetical protein